MLQAVKFYHKRKVETNALRLMAAIVGGQVLDMKLKEIGRKQTNLVEYFYGDFRLLPR